MSAGAVLHTGTADPLEPHLKEARKLTRWGIAVVVFGLLPVGAWLSFAPLASAVVAPAFVKVDLNRRSVQHAEGGTVREVLVRDGQQVKQGERCDSRGAFGRHAERRPR